MWSFRMLHLRIDTLWRQCISEVNILFVWQYIFTNDRNNSSLNSFIRNGTRLFRPRYACLLVVSKLISFQALIYIEIFGNSLVASVHDWNPRSCLSFRIFIFQRSFRRPFCLLPRGVHKMAIVAFLALSILRSCPDLSRLLRLMTMLISFSISAFRLTC